MVPPSIFISEVIISLLILKHYTYLSIYAEEDCAKQKYSKINIIYSGVQLQFIFVSEESPDYVTLIRILFASKIKWFFPLNVVLVALSSTDCHGFRASK